VKENERERERRLCQIFQDQQENVSQSKKKIHALWEDGISSPWKSHFKMEGKV